MDFNGEVFTGGKFVIDMTSIGATDVSGNMKEKLDGHLKSDDFFGVAKFTEAKLDITKVISRGKPGEYKVVAKLTIKNITKEVKFDAMVAKLDTKKPVVLLVRRGEASQFLVIRPAG